MNVAGLPLFGPFVVRNGRFGFLQDLQDAPRDLAQISTWHFVDELQPTSPSSTSQPPETHDSYHSLSAKQETCRNRKIPAKGNLQNDIREIVMMCLKYLSTSGCIEYDYHHQNEKRGIDVDSIKDMVESIGFEAVGKVDPASFTVHTEVRDMCATNQCGHYDSSWSCPPACGDLEEYQEKMVQYKNGFVFQTVAQMEDDFDFEAIEEGGVLHAERFNKLVDLISESDVDVMALSAGTCTRCKECTYPDEPCRFPEKVFPSMEACGLIVAETCTAAGIPYNHGPRTLAFCSCVLYN